MLYHFFTKNSDNIKIIYKCILSVLICFIALGAFFCVSAFVITKIDLSYEAMPVIIAVNLGFSSALSGFVLSKMAKENGLFWGTFAGVTIFAVIMLISLFAGYFKLNTNFFTKFSISLISGTIAGIVGVNVN
ncbi:MAG: TIGR04086 family membrane protein [Oscillospiraceae bacterium]|nr:TIGR04086 family membrane protein [Oscillospiraceae bacterium]